MTKPKLCPQCLKPLSRKPNESPNAYAARQTCGRSCAQSLQHRKSTPPAAIPEPVTVRPSAIREDATPEEAFLHDYEQRKGIKPHQRRDAFCERLSALQVAFPEAEDRALRRIVCDFDLRSKGDDILREAVEWERPRKAVYSGVKKG